MGRVICLKAADVDTYIERCRFVPGTIAHLYPPRKGEDRE
jgi:hypothetical protein